MLYSDEIYIEDFKRTYTEAYRKGFIDGFNERGYLLTYIGNDHIKAEQGEPNCSEKPNNCKVQMFADILFDKEWSKQFIKECKAMGIEPQAERSE